MANPMTSVVIPGPDGSEWWASPHRGRFRVPDFGEFFGQVSLSAKMAASLPCSVTFSARWSRWVPETASFEPVGSESVVYGPLRIGDEGGEFGYVSHVAFTAPAPDGATHWQPVVRWTESEDPTSGLPPGAKVRVDDIFIPDNGWSVADRPYLDGDQPDAMWEGPRFASTSVYGVPLPSVTDLATLDPELLVDVDFGDLLDLDDDLLTP